MNCFTRFLFKESFSYAQFQTKDFKIWAVVVAQLTNWSLLTLELGGQQLFTELFLKKSAKPGLFLLIFVLFSSQWQVQYKFDYKKYRWCAWDSNPGRQMVGADESTELWRHPNLCLFTLTFKRNKNQINRSRMFLRI